MGEAKSRVPNIIEKHCFNNDLYLNGCYYTHTFEDFIM